jgi:hypothetical protein
MDILLVRARTSVIWGFMFFLLSKNYKKLERAIVPDPQNRFSLPRIFAFCASQTELPSESKSQQAVKESPQ